MEPIVRFDVDGMFRRSGNRGMPADMHRLLSKHCGSAPNLAAIQMWKVRSVVPSQWQAAVLFALMHEGHAVADLMLPPLQEGMRHEH